MSAQMKMPVPKQPVAVRVDPRPSLARRVIVTTPDQIGGQNEHAAIITKVIDDDVVNVMVLPAIGMPYPIPSVYHIRHSAAGSLHWKWPSRG